MKNLGDVGAGHVLGRYELLMPIATGGMATVWAARLKGTRGFQKIVAIKTILPQLSEDPQFEQMFLDEASLASRIRHPNVAQILDLGEEAGVLFIVMDWVDGEPLSSVLKAASRDQGGGIPLPITIRTISQAAAGLHAAHELSDESGTHLGLVHRDASPQNILVTFEGVVKVVDFGIAKAAGRGGADTNAGQIKGKAAYMSPEQVRGEELDRRTDVFALGTILYLMTTGKHPFRGQNDVATLYNISSESPARLPSKVNRHYPLSLEAVVMRAIAKNPAERFSSAHELQRALDMALPASQRLTTDAEVSTYMQNLLGERHEQRKGALKAALRLADQRAQGAVSTSDPISSAGFTPPSAISSLQPARELRSDRPKHEDTMADGWRSSGSSTDGGVTSGGIGISIGGHFVRGQYVALAALGVAAGVGIGLVFVHRSSTSAGRYPAPIESSASVVAATPRLDALRSDLPTVSLGAPEVASAVGAAPERAFDAQVDVASPKAAWRGPAPANHGAAVLRPPLVATPAAPPPATPAPTPTSTTFVPPVRNPGF